MAGSLLAGIDVGTGSARAGLFDRRGILVAVAKQPIQMWREAGDIVEQSSDDIWRACCVALADAMQQAGARAADVAGLGFDATCSLVVLGDGGKPLAAGPSGDSKRNVIVWMDHRAVDEAKAIDATGDEVLRYVGGTISPEMEMPKLLWLKRHMTPTFDAAADFFDLTDFLTWRATGSRARSMCTVTGKWTYLAHESRWSDDFLSRIGLPELAADDHRRIGREICSPGTAAGSGVSPAAAVELGLAPGTPVAIGLIDAHAGGLGTLGGVSVDGAPNDPLARLGYIMGTSACIMASTKAATFIPGVWGPYFSAMLPGLWLNEGGQSAAGAAIDHIVRIHPALSAASAAAQSDRMSLLDYLEKRLEGRFGNTSEIAAAAADRHILPEFLGNRSPHADPEARAIVVGGTLDDSIEDLERSYVAGLCGIAYGLAEVIDVFRERGVTCDSIVASGGASHSRLVRQIMADATGVAVVLPETPEPVLLGAAMLGAVASGDQPSLLSAMKTMARDREMTFPTETDLQAFHQGKRRIHDEMRMLERKGRAAMRPWVTTR